MGFLPSKNTKFSGDVVTDTAGATDSDESLATTAFVQAATGSASANRPVGRMARTSAQAIAHGTWTAISFQSELTDTGSMVNIASTPTRWTCDTPGTHVFVGSVDWAGDSSTSGRTARLVHKNSAGAVQAYYAAGRNPDSFSRAAHDVAQIITLAAGDYVELEVLQTSGASRNTGTIDSTYHAVLSGAWVGGTGAAWGNAGGVAYHATTQLTGASDTWTTLSLNTEVFDTDGGHDTVTNNSRWTCVTSGNFIAVANVTMVSSGAIDDGRGVRIRKNGVVVPGSFYFQRPATSLTGSSQMQAVAIVPMSAGDYIEVQAVSHIASQTIAAATANDTSQCSLGLLRVGYQTNPSNPANAKVSIRSGPGTAQSIASGVPEWIDFNTTVHNNGCTIDTSGGDNSATNYIQVPTAGLYHIIAKVCINPAVSGRVIAHLYNQTTGAILDEDQQYGTNGVEWILHVNTHTRLAAGDKIGLKAYSPTGATTIYGETGATGDRLNHLEICRIAD